MQFFRRVLSPSIRRDLRRLLERLGYKHRFLRFRDKGFAFLRGQGVEIGAFEHPASVPRGCRVKYVDAISPAQAALLFPEVQIERLVPIDYLLDLDRDGLNLIPSASQDFVIACHVIEHLANPGRFVQECIRVVRPGGQFVIAAPDRDFTFDRARPLTPLSTLERFYAEGRPPVGPLDYKDIIDYVHPELAGLTSVEIEQKLKQFYQRREHLSAWNSTSFREFLTSAFGWVGAHMTITYEVMSDRNRFEYFGVWRKNNDETS